VEKRVGERSRKKTEKKQINEFPVSGAAAQPLGLADHRAGEDN